MNQLQGLIAEPLIEGNGYTWTYASRLGNMLALAEELYGERDHTYTILGVEFVSGIPQIWYPGHGKNIVIQLSKACIVNIQQGCYQLAHECIHLLAPTGGQNANVLEEGLATHFAAFYMAEKMGAPGWRGTVSSYAYAEQLVKQLLAFDSNAIRNLREVQPVLSKISAELIAEKYPAFPEADAIQLTEKFRRQ